jgi:hypothetical protein
MDPDPAFAAFEVVKLVGEQGQGEHPRADEAVGVGLAITFIDRPEPVWGGRGGRSDDGPEAADPPAVADRPYDRLSGQFQEGVPQKFSIPSRCGAEPGRADSPTMKRCKGKP